MTRRRTHPATDRASMRLDRAATIIPQILDHLDEQRGQVAALTGANDSGRISGTSHADPTAIVALVLDGIDRHRGHITDAIDAVHRAIDVLDDACRTALGHRVSADQLDEARPRCIGDGTAQGAGCWNIPSPRRLATGSEVDDGRCHVCGPRHDARRRAESDARRRRRHAT